MPIFAMPLIFTVARAYLSSWGGWILPLLAKVPWQVWAGIGLVIAFLWYGHVRENRGYDKCHAEVVTATNKEVARRDKAAKDVIAEAQSRAEEATRRASEAESKNDLLQKDVAALKTAKTICVPKSITDRFDQSRRVRGSK